MTCENSNPVNSSTTQPILPLANGNTWNYGRTFVRADSSVSDTTFITMTASGPDTIEAFIGYRITNLVVLPIGAVLLANHPDGIYAKDDPSSYPQPSPITPVLKFLKYPTTVGDTLTYKNLLIRTKNTFEAVTATAGTFSCYHYEVLDDSLVAEVWLSPGVGLVRSWIQIGSSKRFEDLRSFVLN